MTDKTLACNGCTSCCKGLTVFAEDGDDLSLFVTVEVFSKDNP
jgi:hypothetical protein